MSPSASSVSGAVTLQPEQWEAHRVVVLGGELRAARGRLAGVGGLVPGAELGDPCEQRAEAEEVLQELRLGRRAVVAVGVLEGDQRRDPGLFHGGQPGGHGREVARAGDDVPGDDVAGDVDPSSATRGSENVAGS